ncbi:MAG: hypothetical protein IT373_32980 [Polyangiaceae bacterium]|nr:hypothetical protein [Polyangiaceae bacterium]
MPTARLEPESAPARRGRAALASALVACAACSDTKDLSLDVTVGYETDAFARDPAVARVDIGVTDPEGDVALAASAAPGGTFDLGDVPSDHLLSFTVAGFDGAGVARVGGRAPGVVVGALDGDTLPLFVQRLGEWARPPGGLGRPHVGGVATVLGERLLLLTGGDAGAAAPGAAEYYDLLTLTTTSATLPRAPKSLVLAEGGSVALLVDDGGATWIDFSAGSTSEAPLPAGLATFADVAGGRVVEGPAGVRYVVGGTRPAAASDAVLIVAGDGSLTTARIHAPRAGAAACWLDQVGLVVAAGSDVAVGLEVLPSGAVTTSQRPFPPDPTVGAALVARGVGHQLLLLGGTGGATSATRSLDADCTSACAATDLGASPPGPMSDTQAFALGGDRLFVVGAGPDGATSSYTLDLASAEVVEVALREPRRGASVTTTPLGSLALVGGEHLDGTPALTVELMRP